MIAQLVRANLPPEKGTGWHTHQAEFHIVLMLKGWAKFMYEDKDTLVSAGDCVHQKPGIRHYLYDYSPDMGISGGDRPRRFRHHDIEPPYDVPAPAAWPVG